MNTTKPLTKSWISEIVFKDGKTIGLERDSIVVIVGANNCGKTQILRDIHSQLLPDKHSTIIVDSLKYQVENIEHIQYNLEDFAKKIDNNYIFLGNYINTTHINNFKSKYELNQGFRDFLYSFHNTENRLSICNPQSKWEEGSPKTHPIHFLESDYRLISLVSSKFNDVFGYDLMLNPYYGSKFSLVLGAASGLSDCSDNDKNKEESDRREYFNSRPKLHLQGDGMRSFVGILVSLVVEHYSTHFIDEPESFLHPPHANILGQILPEIADGKQLWIATHSDELLKGLIDKNSERVKVIRVDRQDDFPHVSVLDNDKIKKLWSNTLLRNSNILSALFYPSVVICESDSDCHFYRFLKGSIDKDNNQTNNTFFTYSSTKSRMSLICGALKALDVNFRVIPDMDILNDQNEAKRLYESCGGNWNEECKEKWVMLSTNLPDLSRTKEQIRKEVNDRFDIISENSLSEKDIEELRGIIKEPNKWSIIKAQGLDGAPEGKCHDALIDLDQMFKSKNIYMVPKGEIENFVPMGKKWHGPKWVDKVLEEKPDPSDSVYDGAREFVRTWKL